VTTTDPRTLRPDARAVPAVAVVAALGVAWFAARHFSPDDLVVYRSTARALLDGRNSYTDGLAGTRLPSTYTPFSAIPFVVLSAVPLAAAMFAWTFASLASLWFLVGRAVAMVWPDLDVDRRRAASFATCVLAVLSVPVSWTLSYGQINLVLIAIVVGDVTRRRPSRWQGVWVGIATAFKLTPGIFIVYLLVTRRFRAAATASASFAATIVVGWIVMPAGSRSFWLDGVGTDPRNNSPTYLSNTSILGTIGRWIGYGAARPAWIVLAVPVLMVGSAIAVGVQRRLGDLAGLTTMAFVGALVSPITWTHHLIWFLVPTLWLIRVAIERGDARSRWVVAAWTIPFIASPLWLVDRSRWPAPSFTALEAAIGTIYTTMIVVGLIVTARWLRRPVRSGAGHRDVADDEAREVVAAG
jgi:alpha-1,2-mannosyltransferase